jgi:hypothetical protein
MTEGLIQSSTLEFTPLEIQLIKSSLATRSDQEIADLLERPIEQVRIKVEQISGVAPGERQLDVEFYKQELSTKKKPLSIGNVVKEKKVKEVSAKLQRYRERSAAIRKEHERKKEIAGRTSNRKLKSRNIDWSTMKSVRVNRSTFIYVDKTVDDMDAIKQYEYNQAHKERKHLPTQQQKMK